MTRSFNFSSIVLVMVAGVTFVVASGWGDDQLREPAGAAVQNPRLQAALPPPSFNREARTEIRKHMQTQVAIDFQDKPLMDAVQHLAKQGDIQVYLDVKGMEEEGISPDTPVSSTLKKASIEQSLDSILSEPGLTWLIDDEVLKITTKVIAEETLYVEAYDVSKLGSLVSLTENSTGNGFGRTDEFGIRDLIMNHTFGPWQEMDGSGGTLELLKGVLVIRQTQQNHEEIAALVQTLEFVATRELNGASVAVRSPNYPLKADKSVRAALQRKVTLTLTNKPLSNIVEEFESKAGIPISIDTKAINDEGILLGDKLSVKVANITLASALKLMLKPIGLIADVHRGRLRITTEAAAENPENFYVIIHHVADLMNAGFDEEELQDAVMNCTTGPWQDIDGDGGLVDLPMRNLLFVRQNDTHHQEVQLLLHDLRQRASQIKKTQLKKTPTNPNEIITRFYPTLDNDRAKSLSETLKAFVAPATWKNEQESMIHIVDETMVIRQSRQVHKEINDFLKQLRDAEQQSASSGGF